jgi:hypothetical protein
MRNISDKSCREIQNTYFMVRKCVPKIFPLVRQCGKYGSYNQNRPQMKTYLIQWRKDAICMPDISAGIQKYTHKM